MTQLQGSLAGGSWNHLSQETSPHKHSKVSIVLCHDRSLVDIVENNFLCKSPVKVLGNAECSKCVLKVWCSALWALGIILVSYVWKML